MPVNLKKAQKAIENYRDAQTALHLTWAPEDGNLGDLHDPLTMIMRANLQKNGFDHEDDVFIYVNNETVTDMGHVDVADFMSTVYDANGNVNSGYEDDHAIWEARWK